MLDTAYRWLDNAMTGHKWAAGDIFSLADCAAAPALFYADWAHPIGKAFSNVAPIGDGCSHGLPLRGRWTRRGHIVRSSHSVRPTVTDHNEGSSDESEQSTVEKGDFTEIAAFMRQSGEVLVKSLGIRTPMRILDVGCGDGTTALPLARLGAEVVGIDIAKKPRRRRKQAGCGGRSPPTEIPGRDACNLEGISDHSFDLTLSVFGPCLLPSPSTLPESWSGSRSQVVGS